MKAAGGGAINEMLVHMLDLAVWYFGPPVETELLVSKVLRPTRLIQGKSCEVDAEDFVVMRMASASSVEILLQADMVTASFAQSF
jgi:predicted dehydrogenase